MAKSPKLEQRKTVWRGISVKADSRPSSTQSQHSASSWEKQPLSPLTQHEFTNYIKTPPDTPITFEDSQHEQRSTLSISPTNSTSLSSSKSSSTSSNNRKKKLAELGSLTKTPNAYSSPSTESSLKKSKEKRSTSLGSLTKPYEQSERQTRKELERKERKEREKLERKARKDQEKLNKELKEQQKKELKEKAKEDKLRKEKERKDRKSKTKSSIFSLSSKSTTPPPMEIIHTINPNLPTDEDKPETPMEHHHMLSISQPNMTSPTLKSNNSSHADITVPASYATTTTTPTGVLEDLLTDDSSSEEFVDFADSHTSIRSGQSSMISESISHEASGTLSNQHEMLPPTFVTATHVSLPSSLQPRPQQKPPKLLNHIQQQSRQQSQQQNSTDNQHDSGQKTSSTPNDGIHSMFYILNSLKDAGRNIGDDDLLDDVTANKMEKTQQQTLATLCHQNSEIQERQFDQHIQALEILANGISPSPPPIEPLPPIPTGYQSYRQNHQLRDKRDTTDSCQQFQSTSPVDQLSPISLTQSHSSHGAMENSEIHHPSAGIYAQRHYDHHHHSSRLSPYEITAISDEEHTAATSTPSSPISPTPGPYINKTIGTTSTDGSRRKQHDNNGDNTMDSPIDKYISNNFDNESDSGDSSNPDDISDDQDNTDSVSFESTEVPDPFLFPSDEIDIQQQFEAGGNNPFEQSTSIAVIHHSVTTPRTNVETSSTNNHPSTAPHSIATKPAAISALITQKDKKILDEALKVRTMENVTGRQVPVMQVNISNHKSPTDALTDHPMLLAPMSAVIESTGSPPLQVNNDDSPVIAIPALEKQQQPYQQNSASNVSPATSQTPLLFPRISSLPSSSATSLVDPPVLTEPVATTVSTKITYAHKSHGYTSDATTKTKNGITANLLQPREQEEADQPIRQGMNYLFGNKFTKALTIFKSKSESEPLYAHGLGSMLFLKAMMTYNENDVDIAMDSLTQAYTIASTQAELSEENLSFDDTFSTQFSFLLASANDDGDRSSIKKFKSNGVLRARVIKAESCLLMGILQLTQENMAGYLKCGLNLKKACTEYVLVWEEYQQMGDQVSEYMDQDTALAVKFGVGTLHILLSSLPEKIINVFSGLPWKANKELGFGLLKSVMTGKGTRSSFGSLLLLSYYSLLSSAASSIYAQESIQPTIECLVEAQKQHPKSCFFLYYAARISRVARNVGLSTQSFTMATASTRRGAWAEVAMKHTVAYEVGLNHAMQLDWDTSAAYFEQLCCTRDWSPAFCQYFVGACHEMLGQRQEAKNAFDEVPVISHQQHHRKSLLDNFVQVKVERYQYQDYRDLDTCLPGLELLLLLNAFTSMEDSYLLRCLDMIEETCQLIEVDGDMGDVYDEDDQDGAPGNGGDFNNDTTIKSFTNYGILLLLKSAVLNGLSRYKECLPLLEWIMKRKHRMENEEWLLPFVYWEAGVTHWGIGNRRKSRQFWELALSCTRYDFEFRMATRVHLALAKCDELGIAEPSDPTTIGRKRL